MANLTMADKALSKPPDLSESNPLPSHSRISSWLEQLIASRTLHADDRLPPEVEMAAALGVSRMTLRQALADIERKGLIQRRRGRFGGNFVASPRIEFALAALPGFTEQMRQANVAAGAHVVQVSTTRPHDDVREALQLKPDENVHEILRVRSANGEPVTIECTYLPERLFPDMLTYDVSDSLYSILERHYGTEPWEVEEWLEPVKATPQQAELLHIGVDDSLLLVVRTSWSAQGVPIECSYDYFRPDRSRITVRTSRATATN